jgi:hypothetical protein
MIIEIGYHTYRITISNHELQVLKTVEVYNSEMTTVTNTTTKQLTYHYYTTNIQLLHK